MEYDVTRGETRTPDSVGRITPNERILVLEMDTGEFLAESDAILFYLADGPPFSSPTDGWSVTGSCSGCSSNGAYGPFGPGLRGISRLNFGEVSFHAPR
ncbi:MAG: hypothetical protein M3151_03000 [Actinomycetota bacterium]|nr:hypothetical protein [Actinomycetota bacterium]